MVDLDRAISGLVGLGALGITANVTTQIINKTMSERSRRYTKKTRRRRTRR